MADKSYKSYEMLAKLLNSGTKENIDNAYDALSEVISGEYQKKKQQNETEFSEKRNALAKNKSKAEKYLDYFMTENGYDGSGIKADAKLKTNLGYNSDLAALYAAEALASSDIDAELASAKLKNEAERNEKKAAADKEYNDNLFKAYNDEQDRALKLTQLEYQRESDEKDRALKQSQFDYQKQSDEKDMEFRQSQLDYQRDNSEQDRALKRDQLEYQKQSDDKDREFKYSQLEYQREDNEKDRELKKAQQEQQAALERQKLQSDIENKQHQNALKEREYEIKMLQAETDAAKASASTNAQKEEAAALQDKLDAYRQLMYQDLKNRFDQTDDIDEKQRIYDSVTGVNAENAVEVYGYDLYNSVIKYFSKTLTEEKTKRADTAAVQKLYDRFANANEYHYQTYLKLKRELQYGNFPGFTEDQLERAYKAYLKNENP